MNEVKVKKRIKSIANYLGANEGEMVNEVITLIKEQLEEQLQEIKGLVIDTYGEKYSHFTREHTSVDQYRDDLLVSLDLKEKLLDS